MRVQLYYNNPCHKDTTWRSKYNFEGVTKALSKTMKKELRKALVDNKINCPKRTASALIDASLVNSDYSLTPEGIVTAISLVGLEKQCKKLSLPLENINIKYQKPVEDFYMNYLTNNGYKYCCFSEGGIITTLIFCMCFSEIYNSWQNNQRSKEYGKDYAIGYMYSGLSSYTELLDDSPHIYDRLLNAILKASKKHIIKSFKKLKSWHKGMGYNNDAFPFRNWKGVNLDMTLKLYDILGNITLAQIAEIIFSDIYAYNKGWADLLTINNEDDFCLIEVKTSDKLHYSQIITIPTFNKFIPTKVVRLNNKK